MLNKHNIILIGFMGVGKTSIGRLLAKKLNYNFIDTDELIEAQNHTTIQNIFDEHGEAYFRYQEQMIISQVCQNNSTVISAGGGVVLNRTNIDNLRSNGYILMLSASPLTIYNNLNNSNKTRPLLKGNNLDNIVELLNQRREYYKCFDYKISVDNKTFEQIVDEIIKLFEV